MRSIFIVLATLVLSACAAPQLYNWGPYEQGLYNAYKDPTKLEEARVKLESHIAATEEAKQKIAPGLYAELGTFYLETGNADKAKALYAKERDAWPESTSLMTALIQNIDRRANKTEAGK